MLRILNDGEVDEARAAARAEFESLAAKRGQRLSPTELDRWYGAAARSTAAGSTSSTRSGLPAASGAGGRR